MNVLVMAAQHQHAAHFARTVGIPIAELRFVNCDGPFLPIGLNGPGVLFRIGPFWANRNQLHEQITDYLKQRGFLPVDILNWS